MALPYFPGNEKLKTKIQRLEERIASKKYSDGSSFSHANTAHAVQVHHANTVNLMAPLSQPKGTKVQVSSHDNGESADEDFAPAPGSDHDQSYASDDSFHYKPKVRKPKKTTRKLAVFHDTSDTFSAKDQSPRTKNLLSIINSRDVSKIRALKGVGVKKADAIVGCLLEMQAEEVRDLESLAQLNGVGRKTVENMRAGLTVEWGF